MLQVQYEARGATPPPQTWPRQKLKAGASWDVLKAGKLLLEEPAAAWVDGLSWEEPGLLLGRMKGQALGGQWRRSRCGLRSAGRSTSPASRA